MRIDCRRSVNCLCRLSAGKCYCRQSELYIFQLYIYCIIFFKIFLVSRNCPIIILFDNFYSLSHGSSTLITQTTSQREVISFPTSPIYCKCLSLGFCQTLTIVNLTSNCRLGLPSAKMQNGKFGNYNILLFYIVRNFRFRKEQQQDLLESCRRYSCLTDCRQFTPLTAFVHYTTLQAYRQCKLNYMQLAS